MKTYVLDACALIAYLNDEEGSENIENLLLENNICVMSIINVFEVCYDAAKVSGNEHAFQLFDEIKHMPIIIQYNIERDVLFKAIYFKTKYKISVADSIALALAKAKEAIIVSSDHHEFDCIDEANELTFYWFR
ncbi:toxin PIN [Candidatus Magnetomorum sp. HK-1]|nr:toxin PIN [Candidatus Magnetomorum sp. HK-1]